MKYVVYILVASCCSFFYNLLGYAQLMFGRVVSPSFWILWLAMILVFLISTIYISYVYNRLAGRLDARPSNRVVGDGRAVASIGQVAVLRISYLCLAVMPILLVFNMFIYLWVYGRPDALQMFVLNLLYRIPIFAGILVTYALLLPVFKQWSLPIYFGNEKQAQVVYKATPVLQGPDFAMDLHVLYYSLLKVAGIGPIWAGTHSVRFFDIVLIETYSKLQYVILTDGSRVQVNGITKVLAKYGLDRWMVKISGNYIINMMLVQYPITKANGELLLQAEVREGMGRNLKAGQLMSMLHHGRGINGKNIAIFLDNKHHVEYEGWDTFITLKKM
ncbi:hypothetical protein [Sphingobacterium sp. SYP-B4668]|uniref:hypothetical protein n=1 Tax=Sphingobacterium sp. SYP-B4668 TaxID=2996035 RepID=UPI0022DE4A1D|nr:hypothetical protein [Sphingobacterium sp. SYP-B4668]